MVSVLKFSSGGVTRPPEPWAWSMAMLRTALG